MTPRFPALKAQDPPSTEQGAAVGGLQSPESRHIGQESAKGKVPPPTLSEVLASAPPGDGPDIPICPDCGKSVDLRCDCDYIGIRAQRKHQAELKILYDRTDVLLDVLAGKGTAVQVIQERTGKRYTLAVIGDYSASGISQKVAEWLRSQTIVCLWCGHSEETREAIREHTRTCEKHPAVIRLRELEAKYESAP